MEIEELIDVTYKTTSTKDVWGKSRGLQVRQKGTDRGVGNIS